MPEKSGFFDSTASDIRTYPARDFADYFAQLLTSGVFNGGQYLNPTATGTNATVSLSPGYAWIKGYAYSIYGQSLPLLVQPAASLPRIDRLILRLDTSLSVRNIQAMIIQGVPGSNPTPPALVRTGDIYDLSIAQIRVNANTTIITQANITDERLNAAVCGLVNSLIQVDTTVFQQQFNAFMDSISGEGYATGSYVDNRVLTGGYGATTGSANVYNVNVTPAPTALVAGLRVAVRINVANTGASTINVNGLGIRTILKSNGSVLTANTLRVASVYTLIYNGTNFILQGEGGEYGTAVAGDVRIGKSIGTDAGLVTGTLPERATTNINPSNAVQNFPAGIYPAFAVQPGGGFPTGDLLFYIYNPDNVSTVIGSASSASPTKEAAGIKLTAGGSYRILHTLSIAGSFLTAYSQVHVNGVAVGSINSTPSGTSVNFVNDLNIQAGDEVQIYVWASGTSANAAIVSNITIRTVRQYVFRRYTP